MFGLKACEEKVWARKNLALQPEFGGLKLYPKLQALPFSGLLVTATEGPFTPARMHRAFRSSKSALSLYVFVMVILSGAGRGPTLFNELDSFLQFAAILNIRILVFTPPFPTPRKPHPYGVLPV